MKGFQLKREVEGDGDRLQAWGYLGA